MWLRLGPPSAHCVLFAVYRGLLEAIAAGGRGWEPQPTEGPAIRLYTDAAACLCAPGGFFVGVWSSEDPVIHRCAHWITSQPSAELFGVLCALDVARSSGYKHVDLVMDNVGAIAQILWVHASTLLVAQQRILRRVAHQLRWQGMSVGLRYVESTLNPADCVNRGAGRGRGGGGDMVVEARAKARVCGQCPGRVWGTVGDRDKWLGMWKGDLVGGKGVECCCPLCISLHVLPTAPHTAPLVTAVNSRPKGCGRSGAPTGARLNGWLTPPLRLCTWQNWLW